MLCCLSFYKSNMALIYLDFIVSKEVNPLTYNKIAVTKGTKAVLHKSFHLLHD